MQCFESHYEKVHMDEKENPDAKPIPFHLQDVISALQPEFSGRPGKDPFSKVETDSRRIASGCLFVAVIGENHDGHDFLQDAFQKGAKGFVVKKGHPGLSTLPDREGLMVFAVSDTIKALGDLARFQRKRSCAKVIAVTGSNGKTSTREMITGIMQTHYSREKVLATFGNYNNEIGLPLTLLGLSRKHAVSVVELGMNHFHEISRLSGIALPDIAGITNVGPAHLEGVGDLAGVMQAKGEITDGIAEGGTFVLNGEDPWLMRLYRKNEGVYKEKKISTLFFGRGENSHIRAVDVKMHPFGSEFTLVLPDGKIRVRLQAPGEFMITNALFAAGAAYAHGVSRKSISQGLSGFQPVKGRMEIKKTGNGITLINDTYNANPDSVKSALMLLASLDPDLRKFFVMGDMYELGENTAGLHREIGEFLENIPNIYLYAAGRWADEVARGAKKAGIKESRIQTGDHREILAHLKNRLQPGDWLLVKGSRAMRMEQIADGLIEHFE